MEFSNRESKRTRFKIAGQSEKGAEYPEARHVYEKRRDAAEMFFIEHPPAIKETEREEAKIRTLLVRFDVPSELTHKSATNTLRVTVYVPGMFDGTKPNFGNYPLETKLAGSMLTGDLDALFMLKAEGMNRAAYVGANGEGLGESLVADVAVSDLEESLKELRQKMNVPEDAPVEFEVVGFSEGSTQAISIAEKIAERKLGTIAACTSIGGAGLVGKENQNETSAISYLKDNAMKKNQYEMPPTFSEVDQNTFLINHRMIGGAKDAGYESAIGEAYVDAMADARNVAKWGVGYITTALGIEDKVPHERVQAVFSKNQDYEKLIARGIPLVVWAGSKEILFPAADVQKGVEDLRAKGGNVLLLITDTGHDSPHKNPSGTAMALELFRNKAGFKKAE
jgi:hypothetical protein